MAADYFLFGKHPGLAEIITVVHGALGVLGRKASGPEVIDPMIIEEGRVSLKYLYELVELHTDSIIQPTIIILLKDNDFTRAKKMLSGCPHGINVKMIRNNGVSEIYKIINTGADDVPGFLNAFSRQCFSTCSNTKRNILLNDDWAKHSIVRYFSPLMFKIRTCLMHDEKENVRADINALIKGLDETHKEWNEKEEITSAFKCMAMIYKVYCNDAAGHEMQRALKLAEGLGNELLLAHVYRYAFFLKSKSKAAKESMLERAEDIFRRNNVGDHAIYCKNNRLIQQFYTDSVSAREFTTLHVEAANSYPGLIGMPYIYNNAGVAHLFSGNPAEAVSFFRRGRDYAKHRDTQRFSLMINELITRDCELERIDPIEIRSLVAWIFSVYGAKRLPFITANWLMNCLAISVKQNHGTTKGLLNDFPITTVFNNALTPGQMGSGSLARHMAIVLSRYGDIGIEGVVIPRKLAPVTGARLNFLINHSTNPMFFHTWL